MNCAIITNLDRKANLLFFFDDAKLTAHLSEPGTDRERLCVADGTRTTQKDKTLAQSKKILRICTEN
jgi:hypothetical protein